MTRQHVITPVSDEKVYVKTCSENEYALAGTSLLQDGKVGVIIMAGGSGTRLGWHGPKGTFPITVIRQKSLFQLFSERIFFAQKKYHARFPIAIMTSEENDRATQLFFQQHDFFQLGASSIDFFQQGQLPLQNLEGVPIVDATGNYIMGPSGNGCCFRHFIDSGICHKWMDLGVEHVMVMTIDNPLIDPVDVEMIGYHMLQDLDMAAKAISLEKQDTDVGVFVMKDDRLSVVEYSEYDSEVGHRLLCRQYGNISFFCCAMRFIATKGKETTPLHIATKSLPTAIREKQQFIYEKVLKREYFIFDFLELTNKTALIVDSRQRCFAPLKNKEGRSSVSDVQKSLLHSDQHLFREFFGVDPGDALVEMSQAFYYPTDWMRNQARHTPPHFGFVDPL